ncbi:MAG: cation diffusion facilitator family transporter [Clostridiales Family XIII bacterium]|nr:cation diffusion facilitator family transporter [Clostridiales Family XIII bacterium]
MEIIKKNKAIMAALIVNTIIAVMKYVIAFFSGSASLFSEAIHSTADAFNQIVLLIGKRKAKKAPDTKHPFGYARATFFASFCVAALLFFVGGAYSCMEAIEKITHTLKDTGEHTLDMMALWIAAGILFVSIILEVFSFRTAMHEVKEEQEKDGSEKGLFKFYKETRNSSLIVIVTEDLTAIFGLGLAFVGVLLTLFTGNPIWDAIGGVAIGVLLIVAAFVLGKEIASLIIGESLPEERLNKIKEVVLRTPKVTSCRNIKTVAIGSDSILIEIDVEFAADGSVSAEDVMQAITEIKTNVKSLWVDEEIYVSTCVEAVKPLSNTIFE